MPRVTYIEVDKQACMLTAYADASRRAVVFGPWSCSIGSNPDGADKQAVGDCRTPEGRHRIVSIEDSSGWRCDGEFAYGPWFLRLKGQEPSNEAWTGIAIHGTCHPEQLGMRASHGCIRLHNDQMAQLKDAVIAGETVVVIR